MHHRKLITTSDTRPPTQAQTRAEHKLPQSWARRREARPIWTTSAQRVQVRERQYVATYPWTRNTFSFAVSNTWFGGLRVRLGRGGPPKVETRSRLAWRVLKLW